MDVTVLTFGVSIFNECAHLEVARIDDAVSTMIRERLGNPYESTHTVARWSAMMVLPTGAKIPFELVTCTRGSSIRCVWGDVAILSELISMMGTDLVSEEVPIKISMVA